jgi:hypothetical protein
MSIGRTPRFSTWMKGRKFGLGRKNELLSHGIEVTSPCVDATITVGDESSDARAITIQLKDAQGNDIDYVECVEIIMFLNSAGTAFVVTGGSTGIAIGTDGALLTVVAKKYFLATSEADGDIDLTWTDTGTEAAYLGVRLPNGRIVMSSALTNA